MRIPFYQVCVAVVAALGCIGVSFSAELEPKYSLDRRATPEQVQVLKDLATRGDAKAAYRLYIYYNLVTKDGAGSVEWLILSARLGDRRALASLKDKRESDVIDQWLDRVAEEGKARADSREKKD